MFITLVKVDGLGQLSANSVNEPLTMEGLVYQKIVIG
jgi:hypothetical protein